VNWVAALSGCWSLRPNSAALLAGAALPCAAAEITVKGDKVYVLGTIESGDDQKFENAVKPYDGPMQVILHSAGGRLRPALNIGSLIRERRWTTHVEYTCNSACPMIWSGGIKHTKTQAALIGFHSAGDVNTGGCHLLGMHSFCHF